MPPNYRQHRGQPLGPHERRGILAVGAVVLMVGAGLGGWEIANTGANGNAAGPCVSIVVASSTGGGTESHCGSRARSWCATEATATGPVAAQAQGACRKAGLQH